VWWSCSCSRVVGAGKASSVPPEIEIAVGALALVVAALVGSGLAARLRDRVEARRAAANGTDRLPDEDAPPATEQLQAVATKEPPGMDKLAAMEKMPGLRKLAPRVQRALASESPWLAWIAGVAVGMPSAWYLAAIAVILKAGPAAATQVAAVLVFNLVAFAVVVLPLVGYLAAPEATRARVDGFYSWVGAHHRLVITALAGGVGAYLLIVGITKL
jgi:Sap, sulfolipid-1-addressing protein